jgi:GT2 family glycosyltransferase
MIISIIIPVFNNLKYTKECLKNLKHHTDINKNVLNTIYNIIVFDDGSSDGTSDWIKSNYPDIKILTGDGNFWWSKSVFQATKYALDELNTDYILLWNNDIKITSNYFSVLSTAINDYPINTIIGSSLINKFDKKILFDGVLFNKYSGNKKAINKGLNENFLRENYIEADMLGGMGTLINKNVFQNIGFWNYNLFPQYSGDTDFTLRAKKSGLKIIVCTNLRIYNDVSNSGIVHNASYKLLLSSLLSIGSNYNVKISLLFLLKHGFPILSLFGFVKKYFFYFGGFLKHKCVKV